MLNRVRVVEVKSLSAVIGNLPVDSRALKKERARSIDNSRNAAGFIGVIVLRIHLIIKVEIVRETRCSPLFHCDSKKWSAILQLQFPKFRDGNRS